MTSPQAGLISQLSIITAFIFIPHLMVTSRDCNMEDGVTILIWAVEDIGIIENMHQVFESIIVVYLTIRRKVVSPFFVRH